MCEMDIGRRVAGRVWVLVGQSVEGAKVILRDERWKRYGITNEWEKIFTFQSV